MLFGAVSQGHGDELRTVVCSELERVAAQRGYLIKLAHDPLGRQVKVDRDVSASRLKSSRQWQPALEERQPGHHDLPLERRDQLTQVTLPSRLIIKYKYDAMGRRINEHRPPVPPNATT
jgi:YD repeat-containing protein